MSSAAKCDVCGWLFVPEGMPTGPVSKDGMKFESEARLVLTGSGDICRFDLCLGCQVKYAKQFIEKAEEQLASEPSGG